MLLLDPTTTATQLRSSMLTKLNGLANADNLTVTLTQDTSNPAAAMMRASSVYETPVAIAFLPVFTLEFRATAAIPVSL